MTKGIKMSPEDTAYEFGKAIVGIPKTVVNDKIMINLSHKELGKLLGMTTRTASNYMRRLVENGALFKGDGTRLVTGEHTDPAKSSQAFLYKRGGLIDEAVKKEMKRNNLPNIESPFAPKGLNDKEKVFLGNLFPKQFPEWAGKYWHDPNKQFHMTKKEMAEYTKLMSARQKRLAELNERIYQAGKSEGEIFSVLEKAENVLIKERKYLNVTYYTPKEIQEAYLLERMWDYFTMDMKIRDSLAHPDEVKDFSLVNYSWSYRCMPDKFLGHGRFTTFLHLNDKLRKHNWSPNAFMEATANWWYGQFNPTDSCGTPIPQVHPGRLHTLYPNFLLSDRAEDLYHKECKYYEEHMPHFRAAKKDDKGHSFYEHVTKTAMEISCLEMSWEVMVANQSPMQDLHKQVIEWVEDNLTNDHVSGGVSRWYKRLNHKIAGTDLEKMIDQQIYWKFLGSRSSVEYCLTCGSPILRQKIVNALMKIDMSGKGGKDVDLNHFYPMLHDKLIGVDTGTDGPAVRRSVMRVVHPFFGFQTGLGANCYWPYLMRTLELSAAARGYYVDISTKNSLFEWSKNAPIIGQIAETKLDKYMDSDSFLNFDQINKDEVAIIGREKDEMDIAREEYAKEGEDIIARMQERNAYWAKVEEEDSKIHKHWVDPDSAKTEYDSDPDLFTQKEIDSLVDHHYKAKEEDKPEPKPATEPEKPKSKDKVDRFVDNMLKIQELKERVHTARDKADFLRQIKEVMSR